MPFHDLDLEFEDEEEIKKKKKEAVEVDVDLQFTSPHKHDLPKLVVNNIPMSEVKKLDEVKRNGTNPTITKTVGAVALKTEPSYKNATQEITDLQEKLRKVEFDAQVRVAVAEMKTEVICDLLSDLKVFELQVNQLLVKIHGKNPETKPEVLLIKKLLTELASKKRK